MTTTQNKIGLLVALPLLIAAAAAIWIERFFSGQGYYMNLATELVGIVITVFVVEYVVRQISDEPWRRTDRRVRVSTVEFIDFAGATLLRSLRIKSDQGVFPATDQSVAFEQLALKVQMEINDAVPRLEPDAWQGVAAQLGAVAQRAAAILAAYGPRLRPEEFEHLATIETHLSTVHSKCIVSSAVLLSHDESRDARMEADVLKHAIVNHLQIAAARLWELRREVLTAAS